MLSLGPDTGFCTNDSVRLNATAPQATSYLWQDGNTSAIRHASVAGRYTVIVSNAHCRSYDTVDVSEVLLPVFSLGNDTSLCMPDSIVLQAPYFPGVDYTWQDGSGNLTYIIRTPGVFWLEMEDAGCTVREYMTVSNGDCGSVFIPNVFTPNGDGRNDTWQVFQTSAASFDVKIFNRWGELLYVSDDPLFAWDGTYEDRACTQGVYFYVIKGSYPSGVNFDYHGSVTIIK